MAIKIKKNHEGRLHRALGIPEGHKIPLVRIEKALHSPSARLRREANFARNERKWHHK